MKNRTPPPQKNSPGSRLKNTMKRTEERISELDNITIELSDLNNREKIHWERKRSKNRATGT